LSDLRHLSCLVLLRERGRGWGGEPLHFRILAVTVSFAAGCFAAPADLTLGDAAPAVARLEPGMAVLLAARIEDCLSCDLRGVYQAIRALQHSGDGSVTGEVVVLVVVSNPGDTLFFRQTLSRERIEGRIERVTPRSAKAIFNQSRLPALYMVRDGAIVAEWIPLPGAPTLTIERGELVGMARTSPNR